MKRLKLHKKHELIKFATVCNKVIQEAPYQSIDYSDFIKSEIKERQIKLLWETFSKNRILWEYGYHIFLPENVKLTFKHYRSLDHKSLNKKLTRKIKEN